MSSNPKIEDLRKKFDENPRRYFAPLANEYRKAGDFDQAIFICQEYLPQQPGHMSGHIVFGQALFEAKRFPEAKAVFETALSLDPENLIALRHLGDISRALSDTAAARSWYERVLHADPRNEEIAEIMANLGGGPAAAAAAPTAEIAPPAPAAPASPPATPKHTPASQAPTVVLTAAAIQEMVKARQAAKAPPPPPEPIEEIELVSLDAAPTVEIRAESAEPEVIASVEETPAATMLEGLEPTSQAPSAMDIPAFESLGVETNMAPGEHATPAAAPPTLDGLDTISLDLSIPGSSPVSPTIEEPAIKAPEPAAATTGDDGLLDLDSSFSFGGSAPAAAPAPSAAETPIDGGDDGMELLDLDLPSAEPEPAAAEGTSVPTMIIEAVKSVAPAVQNAVESTIPMVMDAIESAAPAMMDLVDTTIPAVIETVQEAMPAVVEAVAETPTMIIEAIKPPAAKEPPVAASEPVREPRVSQSVPFVTETMAQLYLSQGHRAEAIDIYRKLIEARPDDAELRARLAAIASTESVAAPAPVAAARRFTGTGPSIRTVLRDLFGIDGSVASSSGAAEIPGEIGSIDMLFATESVAEALSPLAVAFDGGYVAASGNIDELFVGGAQ